MNILPCKHRFDSKLTIKKQWIPSIEFKTPYEIEILEKYAKVIDAEKKLLETLKFNNDNIVSVDIKAWTYEVIRDKKIKKLPITRLSSGERLLAICRMAEETQQSIYISNELTQLSKPSIIKLMNDFKDSKYITLVPPTSNIQYILESINK